MPRGTATEGVFGEAVSGGARIGGTVATVAHRLEAEKEGTGRAEGKRLRA